MLRTRRRAVLSPEECPDEWPEQRLEEAPDEATRQQAPAQESLRSPRGQLRRVAGQGAAAGICRIALALVLVGALGGLTSCQRKAPGPDECLAFAKIWLQQRKFESVL